MLRTWLRPGSVNQTSDWRELFGIKQSQPYPSGMSTDDGVMFEVQQRAGELVFMSHWHDLWSLPVSAGAWVPISVEGVWSADSAKGWLRFRAGSQVSGKFNEANLLRNTQNGSTAPSYLEMGPPPELVPPRLLTQLLRPERLRLGSLGLLLVASSRGRCDLGELHGRTTCTLSRSTGQPVGAGQAMLGS